MLVSTRFVFAQAGPELLAATINALRTHPQPPRGRPAHTTGRTEAALRYENDDEGVALFGPSHIQAQITGRGPTTGGGGGPGQRLSDVLAQWAQDKGIQLSAGMSYKSFGFLAARKMHKLGSELYRLGQPSGLLDQVLSREYIETLKARIAAGEMVAITTALRHALQSS